MKTIEKCRVCGGEIKDIMSLGEHYVSDFPLPNDPEGVKAPLDLVLCLECRLFQLKHTVSPEVMYRNYWYRSGINASMTNALADIAFKAEELMHLSSGDTVLDIGCNDGTLLKAYKTEGIGKVGFDPAENMLEYSEKVADVVVPNFFSIENHENERSLSGVPKYKVVTSIAMFYDLDDPNSFVDSIKKVMDKDGLWIIQMSYLPAMLKQNAFDNVCHEHLEYYSLTSLNYLLELHDMSVVDVEENDVNGGSYRVYVRNNDADESKFGDATYRELAEHRVEKMLCEEKQMHLSTMTPYMDFAFWVDRIREDVREFIYGQRATGFVTYVYGASTKGNTLLQYFGLDRNIIPCAVERNPDKVGRVTVGTKIPIISEEEARKSDVDYLLVLPWHFIDEFKKRENGLMKEGKRFILPAPHFTLI